MPSEIPGGSLEDSGTIRLDFEGSPPRKSGYVMQESPTDPLSISHGSWQIALEASHSESLYILASPILLLASSIPSKAPKSLERASILQLALLMLIRSDARQPFPQPAASSQQSAVSD